MFQEASGAPDGSRSAKMERRRSFWYPFLFHFGTPFSRDRPFGPLWVGRFREKGDLEGVQKWGRKRERNGAENGAILVSISTPFRDLIANLPLL